jgi:PBSX family phage terminase large subunit
VIASVEITAANRPFRPYGANKEIFSDRSKELLLVGPAGTGKSRAILEKCFAMAEKYPRSRGLFLRQTRHSLTESGLVTWEEKVVPEKHPILNGPARLNRHSYVFPNGSEIILGGMDKPTKVMSTEYDWAYIQEAIELTEEAWEAVTSRLRNGVMPFQQLIADTNPDKPTHWLKSRIDNGQTKALKSLHHDNPVFWDHDKNDWTQRGREYILGTLANLTGPRRGRLYLGNWTGAEGTVYEDSWDRTRNVIPRFDIPPEWPRTWVIDFGYTNPFVWQAWAEDPDGRLYRYREIYHTKRLVRDHSRRIMELTRNEPRPVKIICDHDAEDRATFEDETGLSTISAKKTVSDGIQAVATRLLPAGDGRPRLFFLEGSLDERDQALLALHKPTCTEEEFDGYVWDQRGGQKKGAQKKGDLPLKEDDHGMDATRYRVAEADLQPKAYVHEVYETLESYDTYEPYAA